MFKAHLRLLPSLMYSPVRDLRLAAWAAAALGIPDQAFTGQRPLETAGEFLLGEDVAVGPVNGLVEVGCVKSAKSFLSDALTFFVVVD